LGQSINIQIIDLQIQAYNEQDLEKFASFYHPDIIISDITQNQIIVTGKEQLFSVYQNLFNKHPKNFVTVKNRIIADETVVDHEFVTGRDSHPDGLSAVVVYQLKNSLIFRVSIF